MLRSFASQKYRSSLHQLLLIERLQVFSTGPTLTIPILLLFTKPFLSFADSSTPIAESTVDDPPSTSSFRKVALLKSPNAYRRKVFFNYEKRMRLRSPPEKVFEYFASFRSPDGELLMKPGDLMRAVVPVFPPSESNLVRDGHLRGERNPGELHCAPSDFFMLFDVNSDGLISFKE
uniref:EF-hand domain-containing protein n=1 Tax=Fagus sylvatica TaxID=28930 RepID=A0A2N9IAQ1_FAGSY